MLVMWCDHGVQDHSGISVGEFCSLASFVGVSFE